MKRFLSLLLAGAVLLSLTACGKKEPGGSSSGGGSTSGSVSDAPDTSCPDPEDALYALYYTSTSTFVASQQLREVIEQQYGQPDAPANGGAYDQARSDGFDGNAIVLMPAGMAARLYQESGGQYQMLAVTNLCGPQLLVKGETLSSLEQLRGRTIHAYADDTDQITILRHLLVENGLDPDRNVTIDGSYGPRYQAENSQEGDVYLLDPYEAAAAMAEDGELTLLADLGEKWDSLSLGQIAAGCAVARTEFVQDHPKAVDAFLSGMERSAAIMSDPDTAADYWSTSGRDTLLAALPGCGVTFAAGQEMKDLAEDYYLSLFQADPDSIGGGLPYDDFYCGVD